MSDQQTLSLIKPDAVERNLIGKIIDIFETNGIIIEKIKKVHVSNEFAKKFYYVHKDKPFFKDLCNYLSSGPIIAMVLKGENVINTIGAIHYLTKKEIMDNSIFGNRKRQEKRISWFYYWWTK